MENKNSGKNGVANNSLLDVAVELGWLVLGSQLLWFTALSQCTLGLGLVKSWVESLCCILAVQ